MSKEIDERYLSTIKVKEEYSANTIKLVLSGSYGESSWGIDTLKAIEHGEKINITGTLKMGSKKQIELTLIIPPNVNEVYFYSKEIWKRK